MLVQAIALLNLHCLTSSTRDVGIGTDPRSFSPAKIAKFEESIQGNNEIIIISYVKFCFCCLFTYGFFPLLLLSHHLSFFRHHMYTQLGFLRHKILTVSSPQNYDFDGCLFMQSTKICFCNLLISRSKS